ncbi:MAG: hypothetical protein AB7O96_07140 [Pseudobdellovibrionaceae bacterium]
MSQPNKNNQNSSDQWILFVVVGVFIMALAQKAGPILTRLWGEHQNFLILDAAVLLLAVFGGVTVKLWNAYVEKCEEDAITAEDQNAVLLGRDIESGKSVSLRQEFRTMHTQVIGTTNAGKSESTVIPKAVKDIQNGSGILLIDGKADGRFLDKLYAYVKKYKRENDFRLFSLGNIEASSSFNPLRGESPQAVTERVFSSFRFENEYYRNVQYKYFLGVIKLIFEQKEVPTFSLVKQLLTDMEVLSPWIQASTDEGLKKDMTAFMNLAAREREEKISGLETALSNFTSSEIGTLFEETEDRIDLDEAMEKNQILYFQLPTMLYPFLGEATGRLVLQCFQSAIAKRQLKMRGGNGIEESDLLFVHP